MGLKYYYNLDGIRGIAALMVVIFHFFWSSQMSYLEDVETWQKYVEFGQHGVSLFFVLSGFVITRILLVSRNKPGYFGNFYKRRVLRIFPLYYLYLIIGYYGVPFLIYLAGGSFKIIDFNLQLPYFLYLQNFTEVLDIKAGGPGHYWSLAVEEHFYLLWPLAVFTVKPKNLSKLIVISFGFIFLLKYFMLENGLSINYFTFTRIDQIMLGAYLAILESKGFFERKNSLKIMIVTGTMVFPIAAIVYVFSEHFYFLKEMMKYPILGILFFSIIGGLITLKDSHIINKMLSGKVLQYLGKISYGIYVWHMMALFVLSKTLVLKNVWLDLALTIALTIILAHVSYFYFERYFLLLKERKFSIKFTSLKSLIN